MSGLEDDFSGILPAPRCEREGELALLLYEGELAGEDRERLRAHVASCPRCEAALGELEGAARALDSAPVELPRPERWSRLKAEVLSRVSQETAPAAPGARAADKPGALTPSRAVLRPKSSATHAALSQTPSSAIPRGCGFEEDLLAPDDLEPARLAAVRAHMPGCAPCREAELAFARVGDALDAWQVARPSPRRWEALEPAVIARCGGGLATPAPAIADAGAARRTWRQRTLRVALSGAAVVLAFLLGAVASQAFRGLGPDGVRRLKHEADGTFDLALAMADYEVVVREGSDKPECSREVEDSLGQLAALRRLMRASKLPSDERRRELINVIAQFPASRATVFAIRDYEKTIERLPSGFQVPAIRIPGKDPFGPAVGEPNPQVVVVTDPDTLEEKILRIGGGLDELQRKERDRQNQAVLAAAHLQKALQSLAANDRKLARAELEKVLERTDSTTPAGLAARQRLEELKAAGGN